MTLRVWPTAVPLDTDARVLPAPLAATLADAGAVTPVILLVAGRRAAASGWAPGAAVGLAAAWARDGLRIVLADLSIGAPTLHPLVGEPNDEGLADVFFYGASLKRVMRAAATRSFGFVPAGESPADSRAVLTDPGWRQVVGHFLRDGAVLLGYVPVDADGLDSLARRLGAVIGLAEPDDLPELEAVLPEDAAVLALLEPPGMAAAATSPDVAAEGTGALAPEAGGAAEPWLEEPEPEAEQPTGEDWTPDALVGPAADFMRLEGLRLPEELAAEESAGEGERGRTEEVAPEESVAAAPEEPATPESAWLQPATELQAWPDEPAPPEEPIPYDDSPTLKWSIADMHRAGEDLAPPEGSTAPEEPAPAEASEPEARAEPVVEPIPPRRERPLTVNIGRPAATPRDALVDALWARRQGQNRAAAPAVDLVPGRDVTAEELMGEPLVGEPAPPRRRRGLSLALWLLAGLIVGLVVFLGLEYYLTGELPFVGAIGAKPQVAAPPAVAPKGRADAAAPALVADSLPYSVAIEAYPQYAPAVERAQALRREQAAIGFFVTPMLDRGAIYYHVMAGPVADSVGAVALVQRLLDLGVKTGSSEYDIVPTRLAFALGDYETRDEADDRVAELAGKNIPSYVVEVPLPGGGAPRWRVYAGAFQGAAEAAVLRPVLKSAGIPDSLVLRTGITPR